MADAFDPYLAWLGIRGGGTTPDHYRLLGLDTFEGDADVIASAADRQMKHVRTLQTGKHSVLSQRILNELAVARLCLLKPEVKLAYDEKLRATVKVRKASAENADAAQIAATPPLEPASPAGVAAVANPFAESDLDLGSTVMRRKRPMKKSASKLPLMIGGAAALIVGGTLFAYRTMNAERSVAGGPGKVERPAAKKPTSPPDSVESKTTPLQSGSNVQPSGHQAPEVTNQPDGPVASKNTLPDKATTATSESDPEKNSPADDGSIESTPKVQPVPLLPEKQPGTPESRGTVPSTDAQRGALKKVKDVFAKEYAAATSPERRFALAEELYKQGLDAKDDRVNQYVLFDQAREMAVRAGRAALALKAIDELGKRFVLDVQQASGDALIDAGKSVRGAAGVQELMDNLASVADQLAGSERFDLAVRLAQAASNIAAKAKNPNLMKQAASRLKELQEAQKASEAGQKAAESLAANPDDLEANLQRGRYLCLGKNDWQAGLPLLSKSGDAGLVAAAKLDLAEPKQADKQAAVGDAWWEYSNRAKGSLKEMALSRAQFWYAASLPRLQGLDKTRVEKRINEHSKVASGGAGKAAFKPEFLKLLTTKLWTITWSNGVTYSHLRLAADRSWSRFGDPTTTTWKLEGSKLIVEFQNNQTVELYDFSAYSKTGAFSASIIQNGMVTIVGTGKAE